jgi:hypothetical protein
MSRSSANFLAAACIAAFSGLPAAAESPMPDTENGRYALQPAADGVIRLDTRTGAVSSCNNNSGQDWACYVLPDERAAMDAEIGRLQADIEKLKAELASRAPSPPEKTQEALPKSDALKPAEPKSAEGQRKIEIPLPSDQDVDRVMSFLERAWRRLRDMADRVQKDISGRI